MTYNQKRHIELLKREQDLMKQKKYLVTENRAEFFELANYVSAMQEYIFWEDRYQVALSMEDFLNRKIDGEELCDRVDAFRRKLIDNCRKFELELISGSEKIKPLQPVWELKNLSYILTTLFCDCDNFLDDYEDEKFYNYIKDAFLDFQQALNEN